MRNTVKEQLPAMAVKLRREFIRTAMVSLLIILLVMTGLLKQVIKDLKQEVQEG